jgi:hypothetical protein
MKIRPAVLEIFHMYRQSSRRGGGSTSLGAPEGCDKAWKSEQSFVMMLLKSALHFKACVLETLWKYQDKLHCETCGVVSKQLRHFSVCLLRNGIVMVNVFISVDEWLHAYSESWKRVFPPLHIYKKKKIKIPYFKFGIINFFLILNSGVESRSTRHCGHLMAYCVSPGWLW